MATVQEIQHRIEEADAERSAARVAAASRIGELAQQRHEAAEKLATIEREISEVLTDSSDVISIAELAKFTGVPHADLNQWFNTPRPRRKRTPARSPVAKEGRGPTSAKPAAPDGPTLHGGASATQNRAPES